MIALFAVAALALLYGLYLLRRYDLAQLEEFEFYAKEFHEAAKPLIEDDETPEEVLHQLSKMNRILSSRTAARNFMWLIASRRHHVGGHGPSAEVREFFRRRPELEAKFVEAMTATILAMSYRSRFWGYKLRLWFSAIETNEKKEEIGATFGEYAGPADHACPAAA